MDVAAASPAHAIDGMAAHDYGNIAIVSFH
jgi:hypothetical protein